MRIVASQDSVLGPVLVLLFVNDLTDLLEALTLLFVDDVTMVTQRTDVDDLISRRAGSRASANLSSICFS